MEPVITPGCVNFSWSWAMAVPSDEVTSKAAKKRLLLTLTMRNNCVFMNEDRDDCRVARRGQVRYCPARIASRHFTGDVVSPVRRAFILSL
jgi:hypothetical protein